jgi:hypothetical protein
VHPQNAPVPPLQKVEVYRAMRVMVNGAKTFLRWDQVKLASAASVAIGTRL